MVNCRECLYTVFSYKTSKLVKIRNLPIGIISRMVKVLIFGYIVGYVILYGKGYQDVSPVQSTETSKVKGVVFTNYSDDEFDPSVKHPEIYRGLWDVADYIVPPAENGALFIATNVVITPNQTQATCPEDPTIQGAGCDPNNNTCVQGQPIHLGNGVMTGHCIEFFNGTYSCEIFAWCPVENDVLPLKNKTIPLLGGSKDFTILIKNYVNFPKFQDSTRQNIKESPSDSYLANCLYDSIKNPECPVFKLGDIVKGASQDFNAIATRGGIIGIIINWNCNLDMDKKYCFPTYSFIRLDNPNSKITSGWNFRYGHYYDDDTLEERTLYKLYGIKLSIIVQGQARKFAVVPLLLNIGAGLGLFAVEAIVCNIVIYCMTIRRKENRYKICEDIEFVFVPPATEVEASIQAHDVGYQRIRENIEIQIRP